MQSTTYNELLKGTKSLSNDDIAAIKSTLKSTKTPANGIKGRHAILYLLMHMYNRQEAVIDDEIVKILYDLLNEDDTNTHAILGLFRAMAKEEIVRPYFEKYLGSQDEVDKVGINFCLMAPKGINIKNKTLKAMAELSDPKLILKALKKHKHEINKHLLNSFFESIKAGILGETNLNTKFYCEDKSIINLTTFRILGELNEILCRCEPKLMDLETPEIDEKYAHFIVSFMVDKQTILEGYRILENFVGDLFNALETISDSERIKNKQILKEDQEFILVLLKGLNIMCGIQELRINFIRFIPTLVYATNSKLCYKTKGLIYEILSKMEEGMAVIEKCLRVQRVFSQERIYSDLVAEMAEGEFYLIPGFLKLCLRLSTTKEVQDFAIAAISSEDPKIVFLSLRILNLEGGETKLGVDCLKHIRETITRKKDHNNRDITQSTVCNEFISYCLKNPIPGLLRHVGLINAIFLTPSSHFFKFIRTFSFEDIAIYLNEAIFERISENRTEGLEYLNDGCKENREFCRFVILHRRLINEFITSGRIILSIWNSVMEQCMDEVYDLIRNGDIRIEPEISPEYFEIQSKMLIYGIMTSKEESLSNKTDIGLISHNDVIRHYQTRENGENLLKSYCQYLKCRIINNENVEIELKELIQYKAESIYDLLGYYKICVSNNISTDSLDDIGVKSYAMNNLSDITPEYFLLHFERCNPFEKYLLLFGVGLRILEKGSPIQLVEIINRELTRLINLNLKGKENVCLFKLCLLILSMLDNVDSSIKIIRNINLADMEEEIVDLCVRVNARNLINGGTSNLDMYWLKKSKLWDQIRELLEV
ncbi:hypothetical protein TCON_2214 [Astathelohania contejeani]|uniref:Uncharacterized protein n=1 Tax=Astathelohania contejeani TaxID=164912 RepID=A0ABQ7HWN3_9MICR|nr:hypothetical protein TCON_2214 [Thelohania contejeani]